MRVAPERRFGIKDLSHGIRFYPSDYLQDSSDPVSEKPLFRIKSHKNDAIEYATLIAPEITSGVKPGMYSFYSVLTWDVTVWRIIASLTAHVNRSMNTVMNAFVNSCTVESRVLLQ